MNKTRMQAFKPEEENSIIQWITKKGKKMKPEWSTYELCPVISSIFSAPEIQNIEKPSINRPLWKEVLKWKKENDPKWDIWDARKNAEQRKS